MTRSAADGVPPTGGGRRRAAKRSILSTRTNPSVLAPVLATVLAAGIAVVLAACGGGGASTGARSMGLTRYALAGSVTGLITDGLILDDGIDELPVAAGAPHFYFASALEAGQRYLIRVLREAVGTECAIARGSGTMPAAPVSNVEITCVNGWVWTAGADAVDALPQYGSFGSALPTNAPGARSQCATWIDHAGNLWLFGGYGVDANGKVGSLSDLWQYSVASGLWTFEAGSTLANSLPTYGAPGVNASGAAPGGRHGAMSWVDVNGNLWLFGGLGTDQSGAVGDLNDLWRFQPSSGLWSWIGGSTHVGSASIYGSVGVSTAGSIPGARANAAAWGDAAGHLWLFGGEGLAAAGTPAGQLNDLWELDPIDGSWIWQGGSQTRNDPGSYGTMGLELASNLPPARSEASVARDADGDLWLFGGSGPSATGNPGAQPGFLADLWRFSSSTHRWTWVGGSDSINSLAVYSAGNSSSNPRPGGRSQAGAWIDGLGHFWLFAGEGGNANITGALLDDLWSFDQSTGVWQFVGGNAGSAVSGSYGTPGVRAAGNVPGARVGAATWTVSSGSQSPNVANVPNGAIGTFWIFGGTGVDASGQSGPLSDLWRY